MYFCGKPFKFIQFMRFPILFKPQPTNPLQPIPIQNKGLNYDGFMKAVLSAPKPQIAAAKSTKPEEEDLKLEGLHGAQQATYQAIQSEKAKQANLIAQLGDMAFTTPDYQQSLARKNYLTSSVQLFGLKNDYDQQQRAREMMDKEQAGSYVDLYGLVKSNGRTFRTNQDLINEQEFLPATSFTERAKRGLHWNITTETEKHANEEADKIFKPIEKIMNWNENAQVFPKNMQEFYGIQTQKFGDGDNRKQLQEAYNQAMTQSGFKTVKDKDGNVSSYLDLENAYQSPLGKGFLSSFSSSLRPEEYRARYLDKDGNFKKQEFSNDFGNFVLGRLNLMADKRKEVKHTEDKSYSISEGISLAKGEEAKMVQEMTGPAYQLAANTFTESGALSKEQALSTVNGVSNIISNGKFVDDALFQKVKNGEATPEQMGLFFSLNKTPEQEAAMSGQMKAKQLLYNQQAVNKAVNSGIFAITRDKDGKEALVTTADTEKNAAAYLEKVQNDPNSTDLERASAANFLNASRQYQSRTEFLNRNPTTTVNNVEVTQAVMREQNELINLLNKTSYKEGTPVELLNNDNFYIGGSPQRIDFTGVDGKVVKVGSNTAMIPSYKSNNFQFQNGAWGWYNFDSRENAWKPALPDYSIGSDGQQIPLTPDMPEYKYMKEAQKDPAFASNPLNIYKTGSRTTAPFEMEYDEDNYKKLVSKNKVRVAVQYPKIEATQLAQRMEKTPYIVGALKNLKNTDGSPALSEDQIKKLEKIDDAGVRKTAAASFWQANIDSKGTTNRRTYSQAVHWATVPMAQDERFNPNAPNSQVRIEYKTDAEGNKKPIYRVTFDKDITPNIANVLSTMGEKERATVILQNQSDANQIYGSNQQDLNIQTSRTGVSSTQVRPNTNVSALNPK